jgi:2-dehydropantoate 2-reductase
LHRPQDAPIGLIEDMQRGRRTEIGEINGFIVRKAKEGGCTAPTQQRIVEIVRRVERSEASPRPELLFDI